MKIIDISWPISAATTGYKDKKVVSFTAVKTFAKDGVRESTINLSAHTGTHVDAPAHFLRDGIAIDELDLYTVVGKCRVLDCIESVDRVSRATLEHHEMNAGDIVLLRTSNSLRLATEPFNTQFVYLDDTGARYLISKKVKAVGIDYLGIERGHPDHPTHTLLFGKGITIIEGLRLDHVLPGDYFLCCLPLAVIGLEAAPARAILIQS